MTKTKPKNCTRYSLKRSPWSYWCLNWLTITPTASKQMKTWAKLIKPMLGGPPPHSQRRGAAGRWPRTAGSWAAGTRGPRQRPPPRGTAAGTAGWAPQTSSPRLVRWLPCTAGGRHQSPSTLPTSEWWHLRCLLADKRKWHNFRNFFSSVF